MGTSIASVNVSAGEPVDIVRDPAVWDDLPLSIGDGFAERYG